MNVAEAFQPLYDQNAQHGIETGVSFRIAVDGNVTHYGHHQDVEFPAVGATEISVAHMLAQYCGPDWLQQKVMAPAPDHVPTLGEPKKEARVSNRALLQAMLSEDGNADALHNLTLQAAAQHVSAASGVDLGAEQSSMQLEDENRQYGMTTPALAETAIRGFAIAETTVVRRTASRAMTAAFPSFGVRNVFTSRKLATVNEPINVSKFVVTNKLGKLDTETGFVRSDTGYILDRGIAVTYAFFERGDVTPDTRALQTSMAENAIQLMGGLLHNYMHVVLLEHE